MERPGGGGRSHRPERRAAETEYLSASGVRLVVSVMRTRHNLAAYEAAGPRLAPRAGRLTRRTRQAVLEELLPLLRRELRRRGAVARARRPQDRLRGGGVRGAPARGDGAPTRRTRCSRPPRPGWTWTPRPARSWAWTLRWSSAGSAQDERRSGTVRHRHRLRVYAVEVGAASCRPSSRARRRASARRRPARSESTRSPTTSVRALAEPVERGEEQLRLRLAHDLGRALAGGLHGGQDARPCPATCRRAAGRWDRGRVARKSAPRRTASAALRRSS